MKMMFHIRYIGRKEVKDVYKVFNVSPGNTFFNLYNIPITFEIFIFTKFTWLSQHNVSVRVIPRKLKDSTLSMCIPLITMFIFWICFCFLWNIINFVYCKFNDNLLTFNCVLIFSISQFISLFKFF